MDPAPPGCRRRQPAGRGSLMTQQQVATLEVESPTPARAGGEAAVMPGYGRLRERLASACGPCPQREGALRREWLCRCPVALCVRLLQRVERGGPDPGTLAPWELAALRLQDRLAPAE